MDNKKLLKTLRYFTMESRRGWNYLGVLNRLSEKNKFNVMWVSRQCVVKKRSKRCSNERNKHHYLRPESFCGIPKSYFTLEKDIIRFNTYYLKKKLNKAIFKDSTKKIFF